MVEQTTRVFIFVYPPLPRHLQLPRMQLAAISLLEPGHVAQEKVILYRQFRVVEWLNTP